MGTNNDIEKRLWAAADQLWANASLRPSEFSGPVLGLIFLRYADHRFAEAEATLARQAKGGQGRRRIGKTDYHAQGVLHDPDTVRGFAGQVVSTFRWIQLLAFKSENLRKTRDLLLRKLISGEVDVSDLDIRVDGTA